LTTYLACDKIRESQDNGELEYVTGYKYIINRNIKLYILKERKNGKCN